MLSQTVEYALRAMVYLADQSPSPRTTEQIATATKVPAAYLSKVLQSQPYLAGDKFTIADAYLFTILNWAPSLKVDLAPFPALLAYQERVRARPSVQRAMTLEGLIKPEPAKATA